MLGTWFDRRKGLRVPYKSSGYPGAVELRPDADGPVRWMIPVRRMKSRVGCCW